jgi:hypothetical protein
MSGIEEIVKWLELQITATICSPTLNINNKCEKIGTFAQSKIHQELILNSEQIAKRCDFK